MNSTLQSKYNWPIDYIKRKLNTKAHIDGKSFKAKVKAFQESHNLSCDGLIGPNTYGVMRVVFHCPTEQDIDRLADVMTAEAGRKSTDQEMLAVGFTVVNRIKTNPEKYGSCPDSVASGRAYARSSRVDIIPHNRSLGLSRYILCGGDDITMGCTHFFSPCNMPCKEKMMQWHGVDWAQKRFATLIRIKSKQGKRFRRYFYDGDKVFLYDLINNTKMNTSTKGGWHKEIDLDGKEWTVAYPGFAIKMEEVDIDGVRPWFFRLYRKKK